MSSPELRYLIVGYLVEKTGEVWTAKVRIENLDYQIECRHHSGIAVRTPSFDPLTIERTGGLLETILPMLDAAVVYFDRQRRATEGDGSQ